MSVKLIYVLNSFHMLFFSILYPNSCKLIKFPLFLMEIKGFSKKRCKMFPKRELTGCLTVHH